MTFSQLIQEEIWFLIFLSSHHWRWNERKLDFIIKNPMIPAPIDLSFLERVKNLFREAVLAGEVRVLDTTSLKLVIPFSLKIHTHSKRMKLFCIQ
ncbi:6518_t:CDS:2 [Rhizophagus irregularis]|nr:6518_t:CDS:2 [Rhizophagus irregularis]